MTEIFKIVDATFSSSAKHSINEVNLSIARKGDIISLLGPSGVGKTTILRTIAGLEKLLKGEIWLNNKLISSETINIAPERRNISLAFQNNCLFPHLDLKSNILIGVKNKSKEKEINQLISNFYLTKLIYKYPHEVSSGEAQRAALIRSIVNEPELLLLDEPFSNLNKGLREELQEILKTILKKKKLTSIIVTHDYDEAFYFSDMCGVIIKNKLLQYSSPYHAYHHPNSPEIANFFNKGEFVDATVLSNSELRHKSLGIIKGNFEYNFKRGTAVKLLLQPEDLIHSDRSNLKFKIIDRRFSGTNFIYTLTISNNERVPILVHSHHSHTHKIGDKFGIKTPIYLKHVVCFKKD